MQDTKIKSDFLEVLAYFVFNGTGKGESKYKPNSIIYYQDDNIEFIPCCTSEQVTQYIEEIFSKCIIALRDKGMSKKKIREECIPWIYTDHKEDGKIKYKGSLHIRFK